MATKRTPDQYRDVRMVLDAIIANGGEGEYRLASRNAAIWWRQKAYAFRKLMRTLDAERKADMPGVAASTPYETMVITLSKTDDCVLNIYTIKPRGVITVGGKVVDPETPASDDPLRAEADALLKALGE